MKTIEEMRTKWCPKTMRVVVETDMIIGPYNRYENVASGQPELFTRCIADECAVWVDGKPGYGCCGLIAHLFKETIEIREITKWDNNE